MSGPPPGPGPVRSMSVGNGPPSAGLPPHNNMPPQQNSMPPTGPQSQQNLNQIVSGIIFQFLLPRFHLLLWRSGHRFGTVKFSYNYIDHLFLTPILSRAQLRMTQPVNQYAHTNPASKHIGLAWPYRKSQPPKLPYDLPLVTIMTFEHDYVRTTSSAQHCLPQSLLFRHSFVGTDC